MRSRNFLCGAAVLVTATLSAGQATWQEVGARLRVKQGLQVNFEQRVLTIRNKVRLTTGEVLFHPDGRFRWEITHRGKTVRTYVYDRKTITEYLPAEKTANVWSISSAKTDAIVRIVTVIKAPHQLQRDYLVREQQRDKRSMQLALTPRVASDIDTITVSVDLPANFISKVRIDYRNQRYNEFTFRNPRRQTIAAARLKFVPPTGTRVNRLQ